MVWTSGTRARYLANGKEVVVNLRLFERGDECRPTVDPLLVDFGVLLATLLSRGGGAGRLVVGVLAIWTSNRVR